MRTIQRTVRNLKKMGNLKKTLVIKGGFFGRRNRKRAVAAGVPMQVHVCLSDFLIFRLLATTLQQSTEHKEMLRLKF